jgi:hypothetical protein
VDGKDVKNWVRLFLNFVEVCKEREMPKNLLSVGLEETLDILGLGHSDKEFYILSPGLHETKTWFLERIITHSKDYAAEFASADAKKLLNLMWEPARNY